MREVIYRRYSRVLKEGLPFPDLILIDGGKGQVDVAKDVLANQLGVDIPVAGLAKNDKHKTSELLFGPNLEVVPLERNSQEFFLLQRIKMKSIVSPSHSIVNYVVKIVLLPN